LQALEAAKPEAVVKDRRLDSGDTHGWRTRNGLQIHRIR